MQDLLFFIAFYFYMQSLHFFLLIILHILFITFHYNRYMENKRRNKMFVQNIIIQ